MLTCPQQEQISFSDTMTPVRLVDGSTHREGRVEIMYQDEWGSVCDDYFTDLSAEVICRQLGFTGGVTRYNAYFQQATGPIWMDDVGCTGQERGLGECWHDGWGKSDCCHGDDVGVICEDRNACKNFKTEKSLKLKAESTFDIHVYWEPR